MSAATVDPADGMPRLTVDYLDVGLAALDARGARLTTSTILFDRDGVLVGSHDRTSDADPNAAEPL